jgi:hypothetical protein
MRRSELKRRSSGILTGEWSIGVACKAITSICIAGEFEDKEA